MIDMHGKFKDKSLLFIGPGKSKSHVDLDALKSKYTHLATLNDGIMECPSDLYFVGEKYIFEFVEKQCKERLQKAIVVFPGLSKSHAMRIDKDFYKRKAGDYKHIYFVPDARKIKCGRYRMKTIRKFNDKNMFVFANLLHNFPVNRNDYIRARTLGNALQIIFNLGFKQVGLIGFMDSSVYERSNKEARKEYLELAKKTVPTKMLENDKVENRSDFQLQQSFEYQCQIMITISHVFKQHGRLLCTHCPKDISPQHHLEYADA
tara:strand:+ start:25 stop:810 length:786 start_codon:yes stop_codon:yes gene_type:complete